MNRPVFAVFILLTLVVVSRPVAGEAIYEQTPYGEQDVLFEFYFDEPAKINSALYWIRAQRSPLLGAPYDQSPDFMNTVVVIHGTEIVTVVKKNYEKYKNAVERMRYYAELGVKFKVCGLAAEDYHYQLKDFYDFIEVVPSAMTELAHWQLQGYALIIPRVLDKKYSIDEIR